MAVAQNESQTQSENVKWGLHKQYERGNIKSISSGKFLGYDKDEDGNLMINQEQAAVVRRIYQEFLEGYGGYQIAMRLNEDQVPMAYGGKGWCASHILKVLVNEKYKGDTQFQKTYNTCYLTKKRAKNHGELPKPYLKNTHPAIIEEYVWDLVQLELLRQEQYCKDHHILNDRYHNQSDRFPFAGRIICGTCGSTHMQLTNNEGKKYWRCKTFQGKKGTVIEGMEYTPAPRKVWASNANNINRRKIPTPREMYCTDIKVKADFIETKNYEAAVKLIFNTKNLEKELLKSQHDYQLIVKDIKMLVDENASTAQDQSEYQNEYNLLVEKYERTKNRMAENEDEI